MNKDQRAGSAADRSLPWLALLPLVLCVLPNRYFLGRLEIMAAVALIASVPAALAVAFSSRPTRGVPWTMIGLWLTPTLIGILFARTAGVSDPFAAQRALELGLVGAVTMLACGRIDDGRVKSLLGVWALIVTLLVPLAVLRFFAMGSFAENEGELASVLAPLAAVAWLLARSMPTPLALSLRSLTLLCLAHSAISGQRAAPLALASALLLASLLCREPRRRRPLIAGTLLSLCALLIAWNVDSAPAPVDRAGSQGSLTGAPTAQAVSPTDSGGGMAVRLSIWSASRELFIDHILTGVGPGQFAAAFPPYREQREIELSTHGRRIAETTEVPHPHNDHLTPWLEAGALGGLAFLLFTLLVGWRALCVLRRRPDEQNEPEESNKLHGPGARDAAAVAALVVLLDALVSGNLWHNTTALVAAGPLFGVLLSRASAGPRRLGRISGVVLLGLIAASLPAAWRTYLHGRSVVELALLLDLETSPATRTALDTVIASAPDSVQAQRMRSVLRRDERVDALQRVLTLRPHDFEATLGLGVFAAIEGQTKEARQLFEKALRLDSEHPGLLRNRARIEGFAGAVPELGKRLDELEERGLLDSDWARAFAFDLAARGQLREAAILFDVVGAPYAGLDAQGAWVQADREVEERDTWILKALAQRLWGREHAAAGRFKDALRNLRQSRNALERAGSRVYPRLSLELAAAANHSGQPDEALEALEGVPLRTEDWRAVPEWARAQ